MYLNETDKLIFKCILNKINNKFPNKRTPKYSNEYYLERVFFILRSGCSFRDSNNTRIRNHYTTIHKKFLQWSKSGLFNDLLDDIINQYNNKFIRKAKRSKLLNTFMDSTNIRNKGGKDNLGRCYADKFKQGNKVNIICTEDRFILAVVIDTASVHDSQLIEQTIDSLPSIHLNTINVIADMGYIVDNNRKKIIRKRGVTLVHPYRKNQNKNKKTRRISRKNTDKEVKLLSKRHIVENVFATLKQFKYIQFRYSSKYKTFNSLVYLAITIMNYRVFLRES